MAVRFRLWVVKPVRSGNFSAIIHIEMKDRTYIAIDLKSFYASAECRARGLDPLDTNLVVADTSRTDKTICLAVSPSLKSYGIPGRCRLFEVKERLRIINSRRKHAASGKSWFRSELDRNPALQVDYIAAKPRMALYMKISSEIYGIYLSYIAPEDIHVYSIDEVFIDVTDYLQLYHLSARGFAMRLILSVLEKTGITATAGIGPNMYLAKVAMDIMAKHIEADANGVRIAELDEMSYREKLWDHQPLTDFWRVGQGYAKKLEEHRLYTMGDIARCSEVNEEILYRLFGVNAELLIDHAWGWEPCTMKDIKEYRPESSSIGSGQVLPSPYPFEKARIIIKEMADALSLSLVEKRLVTQQIVLAVGYDSENMKKSFTGLTKQDHYGRIIPKGVHGSFSFPSPTSSSKELIEAAIDIFSSITDRSLLIRRVYLTAMKVIDEETAGKMGQGVQLELFTDISEYEERKEIMKAETEKERKLQDATLLIKKKYGKNALLRGISLEDGATARERNEQIGGHKA